VRVGDFFRITSGASIGEGGFIQRILYNSFFVDQTINGLILEGAGIGANFTSQSYTITRAVTVPGTAVFNSVTTIVNLTPQSVGDNGLAWLSILDGQSKCVPMWLGRGSLRFSGVSAGTPDAVALFPSDPSTSLIALAGIQSAPGDIGGWLLLGGMTAQGGRNLGLHRVVKNWNVNSTSAASSSTLIASHQDLDVYFGQFAAETFPVGSTWRLYSAGEMVYVAINNRTTGILTLFPPGINTPMPATTTTVELADELPFEAEGLAIGMGNVTVEVDKKYLPTTTPVFESVTVAGQGIGDGWTITNGTADTTTDATARSRGYLVPRFTLLAGTGAGDMSVSRNAPAVLAYKGLDRKSVG
jgi:hypothetical protein